MAVTRITADVSTISIPAQCIIIQDARDTSDKTAKNSKKTAGKGEIRGEKKEAENMAEEGRRRTKERNTLEKRLTEYETHTRALTAKIIRIGKKRAIAALFL